MKLTIDNFTVFVPENEQSLLESLLIDIDDLNSMLDDHGQNYRHIYIDIQITHDEYSPERVDPCPDYYGFYRIYNEKDPYNPISLPLSINELDTNLFLLYRFIESELS